VPTKMNRPKMIRVTIRLTQEQWEWAHRMAIARGVSMAQVIRDAIDSMIELDEAESLKSKTETI